MKSGKKLANANNKARLKRNQTEKKKEQAAMRSKMNGISHPHQSNDGEADDRD